jgi:hypothetical protein
MGQLFPEMEEAAFFVQMSGILARMAKDIA